MRQEISPRRLLAGVGLVAVLTAAGAWAAGSLPTSGEPANLEAVRDSAPLAVAVITVEQSDAYVRRVSHTGHVVAARTSDLQFEHVGKVVAIEFDEGEAVSAGAEIARIDVRKLEARQARLVAEVARARAGLRELENGEREEDVRAARAAVVELTARVRNLDADADRARRLRDGRTLTESTLEEVVANRDATRAQREAARARLEQLESGPRREKIDAQAALVQALEASVAEVDAELADSRIVAPFAGTIAKRFVDDGEIVGPGTPIVRLVETDVLEVRVGLPSHVAVQVSSGGPIEVRVAGHQVSATFDRLLPVVEERTRTRGVLLSLSSGTEVAPGQVAEVVAESEIAERGFWVPQAALVSGVRGLWTCFAVVPVATVENGTGWQVERRDVEVLHLEDGRAYVRGTLFEGDRIVADGAHRIVAGQRIRPVPHEET